MQDNRVYSATSITDVINLLKQYRLSGLLIIRRASDPSREEARINVELGQPVQIRQGSYEELVSNATLSRLLGWGKIYFIFHAIEPTLKLPPPQRSQPPNIPQAPQPPVPSTAAEAPPSRPRFSSAVTRPLPTITPQTVRDQAESYNTQASGAPDRATGLPSTPFPGTPQVAQNLPPDYISNLLFSEPVHRLALEMAIASLTPTGKSYPITQIPRYDRIIYLLINGRRTIANLAQLTKRGVDEVCNSLYRLKQQELIVIRL